MKFIIKIGGISLYEREDKNALIVEFDNYKYNEFNNKVVEEFNQCEIETLKNVIETYVIDVWNKEVYPLDKAYSDEITYYKNEVERSLLIRSSFNNLHIMQLHLDCYTDRPFDDFWLELTPGRSKTIVELMYGYLNNY